MFCGKIPRDMYEDELIPLFEKCGTIWDLRLMMDPLTNLNRGYAFVTFTTTDAALEAVRQVHIYLSQLFFIHYLIRCCKRLLEVFEWMLWLLQAG